VLITIWFKLRKRGKPANLPIWILSIRIKLLVIFLTLPPIWCLTIERARRCAEFRHKKLKISAPALIINIVERCILCFISPEIFTAARPSPFVNKGLINISAKGKRAMEMQWYFLMIEPKTPKTERTRCGRRVPGFIRAHNPSHQKMRVPKSDSVYFFRAFHSLTHTDLCFIIIRYSPLLGLLRSGIQVSSTVSAAPHSVPWNLAGKNHATAFVCDCRCADRSSWQYFNIVRSYSVAEHNASLLSVVRVSCFNFWFKTRLSFSRAWGESEGLLGCFHFASVVLDSLSSAAFCSLKSGGKEPRNSLCLWLSLRWPF